MLSEKLQKALNEQIKHELYSAYLYLAMSAHFEETGMPGFANWTAYQAKEEQEHALKLYQYVHERMGHVAFQAIDAPPASFGSALEVFEMIAAHEQKVTSLINKLYEMALADKDYPAQIMLHWFISEQVEEERNVAAIVDQIKMAGDRPGNLMYIDRHVGKRGE